jgi:hypothetical protein
MIIGKKIFTTFIYEILLLSRQILHFMLEVQYRSVKIAIHSTKSVKSVFTRKVLMLRISETRDLTKRNDAVLEKQKHIKKKKTRAFHKKYSFISLSQSCFFLYCL